MIKQNGIDTDLAQELNGNQFSKRVTCRIKGEVKKAFQKYNADYLMAENETLQYAVIEFLQDRGYLNRPTRNKKL